MIVAFRDERIKKGNHLCNPNKHLYGREVMLPLECWGRLEGMLRFIWVVYLTIIHNKGVNGDETKQGLS